MTKQKNKKKGTAFIMTNSGERRRMRGKEKEIDSLTKNKEFIHGKHLYY